MIVAAHAKINLFLDITGRRADGYHLIDTVFQSVALCDVVTVELAGDITVRCDAPGIPCDGRNIANRAAAAFYARTGLPGGADIFIEKHIPQEAGLGGGSADGAAVLSALNRLHGGPLSAEILREVGLSVGADLPFCLSGGTARATGIGEMLTPLPALSGAPVVIVKPPFGISTAAAYRAYDERPPAARRAIDLAGVLSLDPDALYNAFEELTDRRGEIKAIKRALRDSGAFAALMSGSGSAVFGMFRTEAEAAQGAKALSHGGSEVFVSALCARGLETL